MHTCQYSLIEKKLIHYLPSSKIVLQCTQDLCDEISEGKLLKDEETLGSLGFAGGKGSLYFKDLGPQLAWTTVCIPLHV